MVKQKRTTPSESMKPDDETPDETSVKPEEIPQEPNIYENMVYGRLNIGARNPLVLAMDILASLDYTVPPGPYSGEDIRKLLEKAYGESSYETLFDPSSGSPVYYGIYEATARLAECPSGAQQYGEALRVVKDDPARRRGVGEVHPDCPNRVKSANQSAIINQHQVQYRDTTAGLTNGGIEFNDPVQGCVADCWLMSALSSIALVETIVNPAQKKIVRVLPVKCYPPSDFTHSYDLQTSETYYTTKNGTLPYYAGLNPRKTIPPADIYESWACHYEKCFAGYYQVSRIPPFNPNNNPDYTKLSFSGTFGALADITGRIVSPATHGVTKDYLGGAGADRDGALIEMIRTSACSNGVLNEGVILYTRKPSIAYTYFSAESPKYVPADANLPGKGYNPNPVAYNCTGMPANHAFSIVGLYKKNNVKYVVLRNPWGCAGDAASFNAGLQASLAPGLVLPAPYDTLNLGLEGIFGLSSVNFMRYFEAFGWTIAI